MDRISKTQLVGMVNRYIRAWENQGVSLTVKLQEGSRNMGVAYTLRMPDGSNAPGTTDGFLGWTRREAWDTLGSISRTLEDLSHMRTLQAESEAVYFKNDDGSVVGFEV
ncbi:hypothetical protein SEA_SAMISTI12_267 [Streptomyces phage Samisti12]|uniref:Uncharacterized protein n=2 Tax=Samistivirus TaxID=2560220 RepID=A0A411B5W6_9CAUD|nr:hypothetical protein FDI39_gp016 [Streptomyces phage Samisti12]YP_009611660.1 hypothetical protein FDI39_gp042 [Streptomyces phage Samisti12]QAX95754.1 hypothetical protein SEA_TEUTSCH_17 [Streptomyces phage Teutsch]AST15248.1 hypothetical protein SEA_SAMISTI12_16 [Streptomyces phage Samisti12]AST15452.1 hypothetical protein SEA_SAMISTI12_267 [Streptomyces phage Samisti12]QAX95954.1 hypothetical protein SEA_TEUTSCH_264 [Streptomyces phage Teutsch]